MTCSKIESKLKPEDPFLEFRVQTPSAQHTGKRKGSHVHSRMMVQVAVLELRFHTPETLVSG